MTGKRILRIARPTLPMFALMAAALSTTLALSALVTRLPAQADA